MSSDSERKLRTELLEPERWIIRRCAGSLGGDLVGRNLHNKFLLIEEKTVGERENTGTWCYNTSSDKEQYDEMLELLEEKDVPCLFAIRWKGVPDHYNTPEWNKWEVFIPGDENSIYRSNQEYPSYRLNDGYDAEQVFRNLLYAESMLDYLLDLRS